MGEYSEAFVGFDTAKVKHSVAIADGGRRGEARFLGEVDSAPATVARLINKLAGRYQPADKSLINRRLKRSVPGSVQLQLRDLTAPFYRGCDAQPRPPS
ncbi:hypothetical protein [Arthrobacter sp.]|uniref:hypothetical protein n=1 Tax=Arthrobacter sp. TaxID=1667 RepID=UPI0025829DC9|nr:hypothetical protein [Arthrobacter sp.]